jgi:predicted ATPase
MDQKIFTLNLSVEATSAYIVICTLAESGTPVTIESAGSFWNDSPEALIRALEELNHRRVIFEELDSKQMRQYFLNQPDLWDPATET